MELARVQRGLNGFVNMMAVHSLSTEVPVAKREKSRVDIDRTCGIKTRYMPHPAGECGPLRAGIRNDFLIVLRIKRAGEVDKWNAELFCLSSNTTMFMI